MKLPIADPSDARIQGHVGRRRESFPQSSSSADATRRIIASPQNGTSQYLDASPQNGTLRHQAAASRPFWPTSSNRVIDEQQHLAAEVEQIRARVATMGTRDGININNQQQRPQQDMQQHAAMRSTSTCTDQQQQQQQQNPATLQEAGDRTAQRQRTSAATSRRSIPEETTTARSQDQDRLQAPFSAGNMHRLKHRRQSADRKEYVTRFAEPGARFTSSGTSGDRGLVHPRPTRPRGPIAPMQVSSSTSDSTGASAFNNISPSAHTTNSSSTSNADTSDSEVKLVNFERVGNMLAKRKTLDLFVKIRILLMMLEREDPELKMKAVRAIEYCSERHKAGHPEFKCLSTSIDKLLRFIVGEERWKRAGECQRLLVMKKVRSFNSRSDIDSEGGKTGPTTRTPPHLPEAPGGTET